MSATKILWGQIAVVFAIVLITMWAATQWTAWRLGYQPQLGRPWFELAAGVREEDSPVDHLGDECVQLLLHGVTLPQPVAAAAEGGGPLVPRGRGVCARGRRTAVMVLTAPLRARGSTRRAP